MTDHHPQPQGPPPTARQQRYLRQLALQRGVSFVPPRTRLEASRLIDQLKRRRPDTIADLNQAGFRGDLDSRILSLGEGTLRRHGPSEEVPR
jgi:hypothetical protein